MGETCISFCVKTVSAITSAQLTWDFTYPGPTSGHGGFLYPKTVVYSYRFTSVDLALRRKCWSNSPNGGSYKKEAVLTRYNFDQALAGSYKEEDITKAMKACDAVSQLGGLRSKGHISVDNECDAPCGQGLLAKKCLPSPQPPPPTGHGKPPVTGEPPCKKPKC